MGFPHRILKETTAGSYVDCGGKGQELPDRDNINDCVNTVADKIVSQWHAKKTDVCILHECRMYGFSLTVCTSGVTAGLAPSGDFLCLWYMLSNMQQLAML